MTSAPAPGGEPGARRRRTISGSTLYRLVACERRLWLDVHTTQVSEPLSGHDELIRRRSREHEAAVAAALPELLGPFMRDGVSYDDAVRETLEALQGPHRPLYQPALRSADGLRTGTPDFVLWDGDTPVVSDAKLTLRPERRPDIQLQLTHYAALLEETLGVAVGRCEAINGAGERVPITRLDPERYAAALVDARRLLDSDEEPDLLLSHSTCESCPYYERCWARAEAERRIEVLPEVWRDRAVALRALGLETFDQLAATDPTTFVDPPLHKPARRLVASARAHATGAAVWLAPPALPRGRTLVWLDLEGDAMGEKAETPIYLWGLAVETGDVPQFEPLFADLDEGGDRRGWERFVARVLEIVETHERPLWVHWHEYEKTWIRRYLDRHGAPPAFRQALLRPDATFDLHHCVDRCVRLPIRSYSIKRVAPWLGFRWSNPASGSEWSVAEFQRAREAHDPAARDAILDGIARYNADDLWAMRTIWRWLEREGPTTVSTAPGAP